MGRPSRDERALPPGNVGLIPCERCLHRSAPYRLAHHSLPLCSIASRVSIARLSWRHAGTDQAITNSDVRRPIYKKQPKDLLLAKHVSKTGERGIWDQYQKHDEAD